MLCWFWGPHLSYHSNYGNPSKGLSSPASSQVYISSWHGMDMFNNKNSTGRTTWSYKNGNQLLFYINLSKILSIVNHHVDTKLITERPLNRDNCHPPVFPALRVWPAQEPEVLLLVCLPAHTPEAGFGEKTCRSACYSRRCCVCTHKQPIWQAGAQLLHKNVCSSQRCLQTQPRGAIIAA